MNTKLLLRRVVKAILPHCILVFYRNHKAKKSYGHEEKNFCPICKKSSYFGAAGVLARQKAKCPFCGSLERHRLLWLFLQKQTDFFSNVNIIILHVAPESCYEKQFKKIHKNNYITADLQNPKAMVKMDITNIQYPDKEFDVVICNHVLEHIIDDIKAMGEFYRVLKNDGWAILSVPITDLEKTYEDKSIITEADRKKAFGQGDHVRQYGKDYVDRLKKVGFNAEIISWRQITNEDELKKMSIIKENIYFCKK